MTPHCFVLMPSGRTSDSAGGTVDFDAVYQGVIEPAVREAGLAPLRAEHTASDTVVSKVTFERLVLCEIAVVDLGCANANVLYQLGIRDGVRPDSTVFIYAESASLPFDTAVLRALPYRVKSDGTPENARTAGQAIADRLRLALSQKPKDNPAFYLARGSADIARLATDVFRDRVEYSAQWSRRLAAARGKGLAAVREAEQDMGALEALESGVIIDLLLSYRAVKGWTEMIALVEHMPKPLAGSLLVEQQYAYALNRAGKDREAESILLDVLARHGPSSETCGILGRVYKDRSDLALKVHGKMVALGLLDKAIDAYLKGFEADWRDAYPGINALTLMELREPPDPRRTQLIPVVAYAVERRIAAGKPDYWDHATRLELAVLAIDQEAATSSLASALAAVREVWELQSTARNLRMIREARQQRNQPVHWAEQVEQALLDRAQKWSVIR
ncbi:MAG: DUF4071 domain-containing protein [Verrucomicrobia bacterium]|nr:DUF4071 domain-containing protein [Verrucomicrobiota bacterium]